MQSINPKTTSIKLEEFIKTTCKKEGYKDVLIGVSGGIDSATSLTLAVNALGKSHVFPVLLPHGKLNKDATEDAWLVINHLKIPKKQVKVIDIESFVTAFKKSDKTLDEGRLGNIMARMRMVVLFDLSKKENKLVIGTENKTEHLLGYYTRFGDEASDIEPLRSLYKTHVFQLAKYLKVPEKIVTKAPTAGLWEDQTDEKEFGFSYSLADEILYLYSNAKLSKAEIIKKGYDKKTVERVFWWVEKGAFKDRVPYTT